MPSWTKEQELAINKSGCNIIVSAGAGSGKTAVLTERVIQKLKHGADISRLLILTFTNAAAKEMKERIRKSIKKEGLTDQLLKIDSAYITTFDSFALAIVKKYHYLINLNQDIEIGDSLILKWQKATILDDIFTNLYSLKEPLFLKLIKDFTIRDDDKIKKSILEIYDKLDLMYDKNSYLDSYLDNFYNDNYLNSKIKEYENLLISKISKIAENLKEIELIVSGDFYYDLFKSLENLLNCTCYDTIKREINVKLPRLKKGMDEAKPYKEKISKLLSNLSKLTIYESREDIYNSLLKTKDYTKIIITILKELDEKLLTFKKDNNLYDFLDISKLAIEIVSSNEEVLLELKNYFQEILIDEYQDTSDLQELFITKIANNNVYMVGDIKQSIYRFRNANPNLFKEKYSKYQDNIGGFKIDLVKNFRSREETLQNINYIFNYIMDLELGGADYKNYHQMVFGNTNYSNFKLENQDNNLEIYNYELTTKDYTEDEVEAFIVLKDIKEKIKNHYQVYDKDKNILRDITYDDFVILIDKGTNFELYKKIFEFEGVSLTILKDETLSESYDLLILKNIFLLLKNVKFKTYKEEFKYAYLSIGRSYLFNLDDDYLYQRIKTNNFKDDIIIEKINNLLKNIEEITPDLLIENIILEFSFYEKLITVGNINESLIIIDYIENLVRSLSNLGYTYLDVLDYLLKMIAQNEEIKYSLNKDVENSVKIMTIHKSKGLEYHICYYTGLTSKFNETDAKKRFVFDNKYGIITPIIDDGVKNTIYHTLYKENYIKEDISERIRLFYVGLTRACEKMILVTSLKDNDNESDELLVDLDTRLKYVSFSSILNSISEKLTPYIKNIDLTNYSLTKDYNIFNNSNNFNFLKKNSKKIQVEELNLVNKEIKEEKYSKSNHTFITKELKEKLAFGEYLHYLFEIVDFKTKDLSKIDSKYHIYFENFFNKELVKNLDKAKIYKEYEFIYQDNLIKKHGIIDLMLEYEDSIDIIDYKLKNIADKEYEKQLNGYLEYIKSKTNKKINIYLYSIIDGVYKKLN